MQGLLCTHNNSNITDQAEAFPAPFISQNNK